LLILIYIFFSFVVLPSCLLSFCSFAFLLFCLSFFSISQAGAGTMQRNEVRLPKIEVKLQFQNRPEQLFRIAKS
jgi:hypothetical protein